MVCLTVASTPNYCQVLWLFRCYGKDQHHDALKAENNVAFESNNAFVYQNKKGWGLSLSNNTGAYATYSKSLVELSLLGNTQICR